MSKRGALDQMIPDVAEPVVRQILQALDPQTLGSGHQRPTLEP